MNSAVQSVEIDCADSERGRLECDSHRVSEGGILSREQALVRLSAWRSVADALDLSPNAAIQVIDQSIDITIAQHTSFNPHEGS